MYRISDRCRIAGSSSPITAGLKGAARAAMVACALLAGAPQALAHDADSELAVVVATLEGAASWYGPEFHGRRTASGERFDMHTLTAAHRTLPFDTRVRVTNQANDKSVVVRINDRGPFHGKRVLDLSREAARKIGLMSHGVGRVTVEVLEEP